MKIVSMMLAPKPVPRGRIVEQAFEFPELTPRSTVLVMNPTTHAGLSIAGCRGKSGQLLISYCNTTNKRITPPAEAYEVFYHNVEAAE